MVFKLFIYYDETTLDFLRTRQYTFPDNSSPRLIHPQGLKDRQDCLYKVARPYVRSAYQDVMGPATGGQLENTIFVHVFPLLGGQGD